MPFFDKDYRALVVGASGALGGAFADAFLADTHCIHLARLSRREEPMFDLTQPAGFAELAQRLRPEGPFDVIVDATGALTLDGAGPEKSLAALEESRLLRSLQVNAVGPVLLLRALAPLLARGPAVYAKLSARVGSIGDNRAGGWYGYRTAKAALNMLLQTAALELQRRNPALRVFALQPGTVRSALSTPFLGNGHNVLAPAESAAALLQVMREATPVAGARFIDWQGNPVPW